MLRIPCKGFLETARLRSKPSWKSLKCSRKLPESLMQTRFHLHNDDKFFQKLFILKVEM